VASSTAAPDVLCRAYTADGDFVGIARLAEPDTLAPETMFAT
jgi:hypothetical protein